MRRSKVVLACIALGCASCERAGDPASPAPPASGPAPKASAATPAASAALRAPVAAGIPHEPRKISAIVNPLNEPAWSGNAGSVRGLVTATGDPPPKQTLRDVPADCTRASEMYGVLYRQGMMRSLADVLVTVTGYKGYVPARGDAVSVAASGCAWDRRTIALTFGQRLEVVSKDKRGYMPQLRGGGSHALLVALPGGDPIKLYPSEPRPYRLVDAAHDFLAADVIVLKYATHAVTRLDGRYEITGIPPGEVTVNAFLPATMRVEERKVSVPPGGSVDVDFELPFDASASDAKKAPPPTQRAGAKAPSPKP